MITHCARAGSELTSIFPRHTKDCWPLVEDIYGSPEARIPESHCVCIRTLKNTLM